ncbi:succinate dehydrogenase assembly factor 2 [Rhodovulum sulfidophilum]|uniref:FAD assembly factor SdhE n=1 Tax=Rhodovulum visakhapatnamense TaxID=364297 RepID=A0ABS1RGR4_9RHOB|nr:succinate dehydrogenase assembly factor 2 [Rhodovulum visakhapatnamense]MBL3569607.1 succinate dehydrogenase assembly factor 2 [Rhodovulum visakhapatnamense]MBL3578460.1 succinate dehydrogenase assembly factor 2 [Rhodovulum visakhapatnamense]OLS45247.1 succinate dehydrogenase assembly factor 2 [Rhodovulum sulfidophilum]
MTESTESRRKRMHIRAWRRGTKEMDLILGRYADAHLAAMDSAALEAFDALLAQDDHDLYQWVTGQVAAPDEFAPLIERLVARPVNG